VTRDDWLKRDTIDFAPFTNFKNEWQLGNAEKVVANEGTVKSSSLMCTHCSYITHNTGLIHINRFM